MKPAASSFFLAVFTLLSLPDGCHSSSHTAKGSRRDFCAVRLNVPAECSLNSTNPAQIGPHAIVSDACASYSTLDGLNAELQPSVFSLTQDTDFFAYYRLNLYNKVCPFWSDETGMCGNIACAVNTIDNEEDVPPIWRAEELGKLEGPKAQHPDRKAQRERLQKPLMGELGANVGESCVVEYDDECDERDYCVPEDESATSKGDYVSLVDNPERFTGYSGPGAHQVWEAIYRENCFSKEPTSAQSSVQGSSPGGLSGLQGEAALGLRNVIREHGRQRSVSATPRVSALEGLEPDDECLEKRVFYRIISGMHTSISTHLCWDYLNQTTGQWGPNAQCYQERLQTHPDRVSNLYFNFALLLRAVAKARRSIESYTFCSGDPTQDVLTKHKVLALADKIASGPNIYDESLMFQDSSVKEDFRARFRNVSRTMDCVGCDKCRLWGKLQTAGYGTALKILFEFEEHNDANNPPLRRTELVALINTLDKVSHSLSAITKFEDKLEEDEQPQDEILDEYDAQSEEEEHNHSVMDEFWQEFSLVWRAFLWVLRKWSEIPRTL